MKQFLHKNLKHALTLALSGGWALVSMAQYCEPTYSTGAASGDYIDRVVLGTIDNTSGDDGGAGYVDFTDMSTDLTAGSTYTITTYNCPGWTEAHEVFIDYDQDGTLESSESIGCNVISGGGSADITFTVPGSALDGATRMRVMCEYSGPCGLDACGSYTWGQAEDYTVVISGGGGPVTGCMDEAALNYNPDATEDDGSCLYPYTIVTCDYESSIMSTEGTTLSLSDDGVSSAVPIGFSFPFYGTMYSDVYISANGYLSFLPTTFSGCCTGQVLPAVNYEQSIFFGQEDLDPNSGIDGTISYYTTGDAGSQIFVMSFVDVPHYPGPVGTFPVSVQVQLHEATGEIKIVTTEYNSDGGNSTMGLEYTSSYAQPVAGRNSENWSAYNDCVSFLPDGAVIPTCDASTGPGGLYADAISTTGATLHWDAIEGANLYIVTSFVEGDYSSVRKASTINNYLVLDGPYEPGTTYGFRVKHVCYAEGQISPNSSIYYFTTSFRLGDIMQEVKLFPNPNDGNFQLQLNGYENTSLNVMIMNNIGQVIYNNNLSILDDVFVEDISLDGVPAGVYTLKVIDGQTVKSENIIVE